MYTKNPRNHHTSSHKCFNLSQFLEKFYDCPDAQLKQIIQMRFPSGYVCTECGHTSYTWLEKKRVCQCKHCNHQTYLLAGTVLQDSKLTFFQILIGIFFFVTCESGISGTTLAQHMSVNVNTARLFLRKIRSATKISNESVKLNENIELDCGNLGGVDEGGKRGAGAKKQTIAVAVEFVLGKNKKDQNIRYPGKACFSLIESENGKEISDFVTNYIEPNTDLYSDGGKGISVLKQTIKDVDGNEVQHEDGTPVKRYNYDLHNEVFDKTENALKLAHQYISNLKAMIHGIFHGLSIPYLDLFVAEFNWRYNHRTVYQNDQKIYSLFKSIFQTPVRTAKMFKEFYNTSV